MTNRTATTAAIILSLAAAGAPAASARPANYVPPRHQPPTALYTRPNNSMIQVSPPATGSNAIDPSWVLSSLPPQKRDRVAALAALNDPQLRAAFDIDVPAARNRARRRPSSEPTSRRAASTGATPASAPPAVWRSR